MESETKRNSREKMEVMWVSWMVRQRELSRAVQDDRENVSINVMHIYEESTILRN